MTPPTPAITLEVDLTNPGQFLACCGLLELASRLDGEAVGWFEGTRFHMTFNHGCLMDALLACQVLPLSAVGTEPGVAAAPEVGLGPAVGPPPPPLPRVRKMPPRATSASTTAAATAMMTGVRDLPDVRATGAPP